MKKSRTTSRTLGLLVSAALAVWPVSRVRADVPQKINDEGRLFDATTSAPVSGNHTFKFAIYSASSGGSPVWSQTSTVMVDNGYYEATLDGSSTAAMPFPAGLFNGAELYLGLTIDADAEMSPRQPIDSVPYAMTAGNAIGDITPNSVTVNGNAVIPPSGFATFGGWPNARPVLYSKRTLLYPVPGICNGIVPGEAGGCTPIGGTMDSFFQGAQLGFLIPTLGTAVQQPGVGIYGDTDMVFLDNPTAVTTGTLSVSGYGDIAVYEATGAVTGVGQGGTWTLVHHTYPNSTSSTLVGCTATPTTSTSIPLPANGVFRLAFWVRGVTCADLFADPYGITDPGTGNPLKITTDWTGFRTYTGQF
jgi:hypothetical protein